MISGRSQRYETAYGTIEFTHTECDIPSLIESGQVYLDEERGIHVATAHYARSDLKRVGRNLDLLPAEDKEMQRIGRDRKPRKRCRYSSPGSDSGELEGPARPS